MEYMEIAKRLLKELNEREARMVVAFIRSLLRNRK